MSICFTDSGSQAPTKREVLDENYGREDSEKEAKVKAVYEQLQLRDRYAECEEAAYAKITAFIATIPEAPPGIVAGIVIRRCSRHSWKKTTGVQSVQHCFVNFSILASMKKLLAIVHVPYMCISN